MKIIKTNKTNIVHSDGFVILDKLAPAVYDIHFDNLNSINCINK